MNFEKEFEQNMKQLMHLLKKMVGQQPQEGKSPILKNLSKNMDPQVNIFILNLFPFSQEELDEIDEILDQAPQEGEKQADLHYEISNEDEEFLKQHGIKF